jgi:histidinol-phosphate aminotransferase
MRAKKPKSPAVPAPDAAASAVGAVPNSMAAPAAAPATYTWEPTTDAIAAEYGLPRERIVRFDVNTSPLPPELSDVLAGAFYPLLSEYPPSDYAALVSAAAAAYGVATDEILPTAGADEALDLLARAFLREGSTAVVATPTYAMYRIVSEQRGANVVAVPRLDSRGGFGLDLPALASASRTAQLVWICEPNNPTGACEPPERIGELLRIIAAQAARDGAEPPVVCADEAYTEFVGRSVLPLRLDYPRLVVTRTLSKAHALAGIRVGFAVATPQTLAPILAYRAPASVGTISAAMATAALSRPDLVAANVARISEQRDRLVRDLAVIGWRPYPSQANFLLIPFGSSKEAHAAGEALLRRGLVPRTFGAGHPLANCLRLTVRSAAENDRLIDAARGIPA